MHRADAPISDTSETYLCGLKGLTNDNQRVSPPLRAFLTLSDLQGNDNSFPFGEDG